MLEDGRPRFFRRIGKGDFDIADFERRTAELDAFVAAACRRYQIMQPLAIGHSNGANILWSLILAGTDKLKGAILLRPMLAFHPNRVADLSGFPILITAGTDDQVVTREQSQAPAKLIRDAGARVSHETLVATHDLIAADGTAATRWLQATLDE